MDRDLQSMVLRPDLAAFTNADGSVNTLAFYTRATGGEGDRHASLVEYRIENPTTAPKLMRCDYGLFLSSTDPRTISFGTTTALPDQANINFVPRELALGVVRLSWKFIDGLGVDQDHFIFNYDDPRATTNTRILRVSLLVLDAASYKILIDSGKLSKLLDQTATSTDPNETSAEFWDRLINTAAITDIPKSAATSLRAFERTIALPLPQ